MASSWERLADISITGSASASLDTGVAGIAAKKFLRVVVHTIADGSDIIKDTIIFNGENSGGKYCYDASYNGGSASGDTAENTLRVETHGNNDRFIVFDIVNIADKEKVIHGNYTINTNGTGNCPIRTEFVAKWVNTSAQITDIQITPAPDQSGNYAVGSQMTIFGADDQPSTAKDKTSITNVPVGTRYEETDTRKMYRRKVGTLGSTTGLIASYNLDNSWNPSSGSVGTGGNMTAQNSATFSTSVKKAGTHSGSFPADADYAKTSTSDGANFDFTGASTVVVWVYRIDGNDSSYHAMVSKRSGGNSEYNLYLQPSTGLAACYIKSSAVGSNLSTSGTIADSTWVHLATTISGNDGTLKFYINGSLDSTQNILTGSSVTETQPFAIGAISGTGAEGFHGYLDQIGIWNRALTATEISDIYNSGNGISELTVSEWTEKGTA